MSRRLQSLPYEVQSYIVDELSFQDTIHLSQTCRELHYLVREERISQRIATSKIPFTKEVQIATRQGCGYATAVRRVAKRRDAFASASPYAVAIVAIADEYVYCHGMLCYTIDSRIRLLDLHGSATREVIINVPRLLRRCFFHECRGSFQVLYYCDQVLACLFQSTAPGTEAWLLALNVCTGEILLHCALESTEKIFVRHNASYLYYGTHSAFDHNDHRIWVISGYDLRTRTWFDGKIHLADMAGAELGMTICFEIINGYFYAVSNQTSFETEEVDWTSFYHCIRFPVDSPCKETLQYSENKQMWRRQHMEGPIDDRWTSLTLEVNEGTGKLQIIETRREWHLGKSKSHRTYYTTAVKFPALRPTAHDEPGRGFESTGPINFAELPDEAIVRTLTSSNRPNYVPARRRQPRNVHPGDDGSSAPSFILSRTKVRHYHAASHTFLDLVDQPQADDWEQKQRVRLRVGSRRLNPPARYETPDARHGLLKPCERDPETNELLPGFQDTFTSSPILFWPPEPPADGTCDPQLDELYRILNPPMSLGNVDGTTDDRSMVYVTGEKNMPAAVVFISFDPAIRLRGLKKWHRDVSKPRPALHDRAADVPPEQITVSLDGDRPDMKGKAKESMAAAVHVSEPTAVHREVATPPSEWLSTGPAMYLELGFGFDFSR